MQFKPECHSNVPKYKHYFLTKYGSFYCVLRSEPNIILAIWQYQCGAVAPRGLVLGTRKGDGRVQLLVFYATTLVSFFIRLSFYQFII